MRRDRVILICTTCEKEFSVQRHKQHSAKYCSMACLYAARRGPVTDGLRALRRHVEASRQAPDACWNWTGHRLPKGYGLVMIHRRPTLAHRAAYELLRGPIPPGMEIDHLCRNPSCVNPKHLEAVTAEENRRRTGKTKLSETDVRAIRSAWDAGGPIGFKAALARRYGISAGTLTAIATRKIWKRA